MTALQNAWQKIIANRQAQVAVSPTGSTIDFAQTPAVPTFAGASFDTEQIGSLWTPTKRLTTWQTPLDLNDPANWQGIIPTLAFNGVDEWIATPSNASWHGGDGEHDLPFSFMAWVNMPDVGGIRDIITKFGTSGQSEWEFGVGSSSDYLRCHLYDVSQYSDSPSIYKEFGPYLGLWTQVGITYGGQGGPEAVNDAELYINGELQSARRDHRAGYVAMEPSDSPVYLGNGETSGSWQFKGRMAGGPCAPLFTHSKLPESFFYNTYQLERQALGV